MLQGDNLVTFHIVEKLVSVHVLTFSLTLTSSFSSLGFCVHCAKSVPIHTYCHITWVWISILIHIYSMLKREEVWISTHFQLAKHFKTLNIYILIQCYWIGSANILGVGYLLLQLFDNSKITSTMTMNFAASLTSNIKYYC